MALDRKAYQNAFKANDTGKPITTHTHTHTKKNPVTAKLSVAIPSSTHNKNKPLFVTIVDTPLSLPTPTQPSFPNLQSPLSLRSPANTFTSARISGRRKYSFRNSRDELPVPAVFVPASLPPEPVPIFEQRGTLCVCVCVYMYSMYVWVYMYVCMSVYVCV